jgi:hypothetical protein
MNAFGNKRQVTGKVESVVHGQWQEARGRRKTTKTKKKR